MKIHNPQNMIGRMALVLWAVLCFAALLFAFIQRDIQDTDIVFAYFMLFLTFPLGYALGAIIGLIFMYLYKFFGVVVPGGFLPNLITWILFVLAGYIQWFILIPWTYNKLKRPSSKVAEPDQ